MSDRRFEVPFDPDYFGKEAAAGRPVSAEEAFRRAWKENHWSGEESRSGPGSSLDQTATIRRLIPPLLESIGARSVLDLPCGEARWIETIDWSAVSYTGGDLLPELVAANRARTGGRVTFVRLDLTRSPLPAADLLLCRDCLVHLSFADIDRAIANVRRAPIRWLLTTTFPDQADNVDVATGDWRPINLERPPFDFPAPTRVLLEGCTEGAGRFADKSLALWPVAGLPDRLNLTDDR